MKEVKADTTLIILKSKCKKIKEITEDNPTLCLSPLRVFNDCHKCEKFIQRFNYIKKKHGDENIEEMVKKVIAEINCKPHIKPEYIELLIKKQALLQELADVNEQIDNL